MDDPTSDLEKLQSTISDMQTKYVQSFARSVFNAGIPIIPDPTGMMAPKNGYVIVAGEDFYRALKKELAPLGIFQGEEK